MTPRGARWISALIIALLLGYGWFHWAKNDVAADARDAASRQTAELAAVRAANRELLATIERARQAIAEDAAGMAGPALPAGLADGLAGDAGPIGREMRTRALLDMVKSGQLGQVTYPAPSVYKITTKVEKLAEVLGLTTAETDTLRDSANAVANELLASAKVTAAGDQVQIEMGDSPAARQRFGAMRDTFRQVLGEDGMAVYEALGFRDALENSLNNLGLVGYTMSVARVPASDGNGPSYRMVRTGTGTVAGTTLAAGAGRAGAVRAPVTDEEAAKLTAERQAAEQKLLLAQMTAQQGRGGAAPGVIPAGPTLANRTTLDSRLGPLSALLPPGF
jgi:hypothetical protein